jgi:hypothetical protein
MLGMISSTLIAPLMLGIREPAHGGLRELATGVFAVALSSVVRTTDDELLRAVAAAQLEDNELVHPSRTVENWTTTSRTATVRAYRRGPSTACTSRAQAGIWALTLSILRARSYLNAVRRATSRTVMLGVVMILDEPGEVVPVKPGGET